MKLSEAIKELEDQVIIVSELDDIQYLDALNLAIGSLRFRMGQKEQWCWSIFDKLDGEDPENGTTPVKA